MFYFCTEKSEPVAHASLEAALTTLRSELHARAAQGYEVAFSDELEFRLSLPAGKGGLNGAARRLWIEDESGQHVTSRDAAEAG
jgi:hypothetical protein